MPNIIEQQDLLKGLPDTRLMTLLQNPVADIPPFLVAAEAQRRQALRQQFAGSENKESVVDTLTKQLANVPQNIPAPAQRPSQVPPTPPMMGVAALQQQQAMQQAAQQAAPQQMRGGGMVQRYQAGGIADTSKVAPELTFKDEVLRGLGRTYDWLADPFGYYTEQFGGPPSAYFGIDPESIVKNRQKVIDAEEAKKLGEYYAMNNREIEAAKRRSAMPEPKTPEQLAEEARIKQQYADYARSRSEVPTPEPGETEDEFRARYEALLRAQEPSDWEKAQKWAAMAEQFLDPSKTTMQSIAGAAKAFAEGAGAEQRAAREGQLALEKGLLEYDIGKADAEIERAAAARREQIETQKFYAEQAQGQIKAITTLMDDVARNKADYIKNTYPPDQMTGEIKINAADPAIQNFDKQLAQLSETLRGYIGQQQGALRGLGGLTRTDPSVLMFTGDGLAKFGG